MRWVSAICAAMAAGPLAAQDGPDWVTYFIEDVQACWNISQVDEPWPSVTVRFAMEPDATPIIDSFEMIETSEASDMATRAAFEAVRRAVIRCGQNGYDLPEADYGLWGEIEITFDPRSVALP